MTTTQLQDLECPTCGSHACAVCGSALHIVNGGPACVTCLEQSLLTLANQMGGTVYKVPTQTRRTLLRYADAYRTASMDRQNLYMGFIHQTLETLRLTGCPQDLLNELADEIDAKCGFRPTASA